VHDKQMTLREDSQKALAPLGDNVLVCGQLEYATALQEWLPKKLRERGFKP